MENRYIDYKYFVDVVQYRLYVMHEHLKSSEQLEIERQTFQCKDPDCGREYTALEAQLLLMPGQFEFRCGHCNDLLFECNNNDRLMHIRSLQQKVGRASECAALSSPPAVSNHFDVRPASSGSVQRPDEQAERDARRALRSTAADRRLRERGPCPAKVSSCLMSSSLVGESSDTCSRASFWSMQQPSERQSRGRTRREQRACHSSGERPTWWSGRQQWTRTGRQPRERREEFAVVPVSIREPGTHDWRLGYSVAEH